MADILLALAIGLVGGFAGGLLGIGGGAIYVPAMVILLDENQHLAQGASLMAIVATGIVGGVTHFRRQNVSVPAVVQVAPIAVVAGFSAAFIADALDPEMLRRIFGVVVLYFATTMVVSAVRGSKGSVGERGGD